MAKATYRGPGDAVELDGLRLEKGETYEVTNSQLARIKVSDPAAVVDGEPGLESPSDVARIHAKQARQRDKALADREREDREAAKERARLDDEEQARTEKAAEKRTAAGKAAS